MRYRSLFEELLHPGDGTRAADVTTGPATGTTTGTTTGTANDGVNDGVVDRSVDETSPTYRERP